MRYLCIGILTLCSLCFTSCENGNEDAIVNIVGAEEYTRLMTLSLDDFDQSSEGFRYHTDNYELTSLLIPEYIAVNELSYAEARNLHFHLGQMHAFSDNYPEAIAEMKQSYLEGHETWNSYVKGSIAFMEKDMDALKEALKTLGEQDNIMNIEFLEKFIEHFDKTYWEAYNADF